MQAEEDGGGAWEVAPAADGRALLHLYGVDAALPRAELVVEAAPAAVPAPPRADGSLADEVVTGGDLRPLHAPHAGGAEPARGALRTRPAVCEQARRPARRRPSSSYRLSPSRPDRPGRRRWWSARLRRGAWRWRTRMPRWWWRWCARPNSPARRPPPVRPAASRRSLPRAAPADARARAQASASPSARARAARRCASARRTRCGT
jgi:hypothetical protein